MAPSLYVSFFHLTRKPPLDGLHYNPAKVPLDLIASSQTLFPKSHWPVDKHDSGGAVDLGQHCMPQPEVSIGSVALRKLNDVQSWGKWVPGAWSLTKPVSSVQHRRQDDCTFIYGDSDYRDSGDGS